MTTTPTVQRGIVSAQEREILAGYATGRTVTEIAAAGQPKRLITDLVADVAKFDRGRARQAVMEYDQRNGKGGAPAAVPQFKAPAEPAPAKPAPVAEPALQPAAEPDDVEQIDTVTDLLDAAERTEVPRLVKTAGRIREQIAELQAGVAIVAREQQLRADVEAARVAYERAQAELREATGRTVRASSAPRNPSGLPTKEIRAWAAQNGVECSERGRVPESVVEQWRAATGG